MPIYRKKEENRDEKKNGKNNFEHSVSQTDFVVPLFHSRDSVVRKNNVKELRKKRVKEGVNGI